jgi:hypothetical protein
MALLTTTHYVLETEHPTFIDGILITPTSTLLPIMQIRM